MKSINAKRIAAVAASLLMGLAFAAGQGGVTWNNIPIISNSGQPVVQVVVGSGAAPSDGVVAANIAAVLGNLAFTSQNVTATPAGLSNVKCVVTTPTCTLTNQQVWFGEKGFVGPSGSYTFTALIGSVLNGGVALGSPANTKNPVTGTSYAFPESNGYSQVATGTSPAYSPFSTLSSPPNPSVTVSVSNGGGLSFNGIRNNGYDNLLQVTTTQLPVLLNNWGPNGESETLWVSGFPVYDQKSSTNPAAPNFVWYNAGGAYVVNFNKPVTEPVFQTGNSINNAPLEFLGKNWTILGYELPGQSNTDSASTTVSSSNAVIGGKLQLAASLTSLQTVYVGHNISSNNFSVELTDLGQPANGISPASVDVFYRGNLTNVTQLGSGSLTKFQVGTHTLYVKVNQTFAGLYAYQKWAKFKLYSNTLNLTSGQTFNKTNAPGWTALLFWSNSTGSGYVNQLQSLEVYNKNPQALVPGQSFSFVAPNYTAYKVNFVGDTLGTNYDPLQFSTSSQNSAVTFKNSGTAPSAGNGALTYISEPYQELSAVSQIPNAFSYGGQVSGTLNYDLTPYNLNFVSNAVGYNSLATSGLPVNVVVVATDSNGNIISSNNYVTVTLQGYASQGATTPSTATVYVKTLLPDGTTLPVGANVVFPGTPQGNALWSGATSFYNITNVTLSTALPNVNVYVVASSAFTNNAPYTGLTVAQDEATAAANSLVTLTSQSPQVMYEASGNNYYQFTATSGVSYSQQNGQTVSPAPGGFSITPLTLATPVLQQSNPYFVYNVVEYNVPSSTSSNDVLQFGLYNNTNGAGSVFGFELNRTVGQNRNNLTYFSSQETSGLPGSSPVAAPVGFVTERGTKVANIQPTSLTLNIAKAVDTLQFVVSPSSTVINSTSTTKTVGPVGVGQAVPGFANLTVSAVNATCAFSSTSCSVTGLANVTATPSVSHAVVPVSLNTATTPLVVLDSNANSAATLIVVGSKYVNSVAGQVFAQNPTLNSSFGPTSVVVQAYGTNRVLVAGYTANQTVQAGNQFINDLLQAASSTQ